MPSRSTAIANSFLSEPGALNQVTQMQLQKLVYFAHGWCLAITGKPLCNDELEAWDYGPVYPDLYAHAKFFGKKPIDRLLLPSDSKAARFFGLDKDKEEPFAAALDETEKAIIRSVWERYGGLSAYQMSSLTHMPDTPWYQTYNGDGRGYAIPNHRIQTHFIEIGRRARGTA